MRLIFTVDFTRPSHDWHGPHIKNLKWLHGLLSPLIHAAGCQTFSLERHLFATDYETFQSRIFSNAPIGEDRLHKWAELYDGEIDIEEALPAEADDVVLGFEMSPAITRALERRGQRYIDIRIHPIRFLKDLVMSVRASDAVMDERLGKFKTAWEGLYPSISMMTGHFRRKADLTLTDKNIFISQTRHDATVVTSGRFAGIDDVLSGLNTSIDRPWIVIAHPHDPDNPLNLKLAEHLTAEVVKDVNLYAFLACAERSVSFYTFTSGGGREAEEFGHDVHFLGPNHYGRASVNEQSYTAVSPAIFTPNFWRYVLRGEMGDAESLTDLTVLRASLGESWAYPFYKP